MDVNVAPEGGGVGNVRAAESLADIKPGDPGWFSYVEAPLVVAGAEAVGWADAADVVVVGFGGAGACAALQAREAGVDVLVVDRFTGGGATAASGGVIYAGGGTQYQKEAGFDDTPEAMFDYLKVETQGVISDATLRKFCADSRANLEWVQAQGARYSSAFYEQKTVYPPEGKFLYYAGNELLPRNEAISKPAPRGHRTVGKGVFCGAYLYKALKESTEAKGVRVLRHAPVVRLVMNPDGEVLGVEVKRLKPGSDAYKTHDKAIGRVDRFLRFVPPKVKALNKTLEALEQREGERVLIRARGGVILSTGGFAFNEDMVRRYATPYGDAFPVGSAGCDGSGIRLGQTGGGVAQRLYSVSATRPISPPPDFVQGVIVDDSARRFVEEDAYAGSLGRRIAEHGSRRAILIVDADMVKAGWKLALEFGASWFPLGLPMLRTLLTNCVKGKDVRQLAGKIGLDPAALEATIAEYNGHVAKHEDPFGKNPHNLKRIDARGKLYAIDISTGNKNTTCMLITMGGLAVDEESGHVVREDGAPVKGLYAAGRTAIGIPSNFYVSGTSIADCVFSGRRAGAHAAQEARRNSTV